MVKRRKLLQKALNRSKNIRFGEFVALIEGFGFTLDRIAGSHHIFKHPSVPMPLSVQTVKGKAKPYQVRLLLEWIEQYGLHLAEDELIEDSAPDDESDEKE